MKSNVFIVILAIVCVTGLGAQQSSDPRAAPTLSAGAGAGATLKHYITESFPYQRVGGPYADIRLAWRIRDFFGFSVGAAWMGFARKSGQISNEHGTGASDLSLSSVAVPLSVYLRFPRFSIEPAIVVHVVMSRIDAFGQTSRASKFEAGYALDSRYYVPLGAGIELALGLAVHYVADLEILLLVPRAGVELALP